MRGRARASSVLHVFEVKADGVVACGGVTLKSPPRLLPNLWRLVSAEWRALEMSYPTGMVVVEEEEEVVVAVVAGVPADKGGPAAVAAGKVGPPGRSGCTSSRWPSEPGPWPCTTPYPSGRAA